MQHIGCIYSRNPFVQTIYQKVDYNEILNLLIYKTGIIFGNKAGRQQVGCSPMHPKEFHMKRLFKIAIIIFIVSILSGCFPGDGKATVGDPAGFFSGIWHGWIAPLSLILGIFTDNIRVYEMNNTGWWYDLGFYMAIISGFGGISLSRKKMKKRHQD